MFKLLLLVLLAVAVVGQARPASRLLSGVRAPPPPTATQPVAFSYNQKFNGTSVLTKFSISSSTMVPLSYRWVREMTEIVQAQHEI